MPKPRYPPQVATTGSSPAVRKVVWELRTSGREDGKQPAVGGKTSVEESQEPPVRRSRLATLAGPENSTDNDWSMFAMLFKFDQKTVEKISNENALKTQMKFVL